MNKPVIGLYAMSNPMRSGTYHSQDWMINKYPDALLRFEGKILGDGSVDELAKQNGIAESGLEQIFAYLIANSVPILDY